MVFGATGLGFASYPYVSVSQLKNFAKFVQKRFALKLSMAQFAVCRSSGYSGFDEIYYYVEEGKVLDRAAPEDCAAWQRRLSFELGTDLEVLVKDDELETWFRRIHGIRKQTIEGEGHSLGTGRVAID